VAYAKESRNNTLPSPVVPAKTVTRQRVAFTGGKRKTITQQHAAFTGGTRKNSRAITRYPHQWKTSNKTRNKTLPSPVVHKTVTQHVALTGSTRKTVTQQHVAFTGGTLKTVTQQHVAFTNGTRKKQSRNNTLPSPVVNANSYPTIR